MNFQQGDKIILGTKNSLNAENAKRKSVNQYRNFSPQKIFSANNSPTKSNFALNNLTSMKTCVSILKTINKNTEKTNSNETEKVPICVISEIMGNANGVYSESSSNKDISERYIITPKKTTDITKIKGWRRKQFLIEKPTTVEFYSSKRGSEEEMSNQSKRFKSSQEQTVDENTEKVENAFVSESLDEFLNEKSQLKVSYEIPHLYAEVGIKLTSEEVYSKPNLSQDEFKKVETQYCTILPTNDSDCNFINNEKLYDTRRRMKRNQQKTLEFSKTQKMEEDVKLSDGIKQEQNEANYKPWEPVVLEEIEDFVDAANTLPPPSKYSHEDFNLCSKLIGLVIYPNSSRPLHPLVQNHLFKLRSYTTLIDRHWADFAVLALQFKGSNKHLERKIVPVYCAGKVRKNSDCQKSPIVENEMKEVVNFLIDSAYEKTALSPIERSKDPLTPTDKKDSSIICEENSEDVEGEMQNQSHRKAQKLTAENGTNQNSTEAENFCRKLNANLNKICKSANQNENGKLILSQTQPEECEIASNTGINILDDIVTSTQPLKNLKLDEVSVLNANERKSNLLTELIAIKDCKVVVEKLKNIEAMRVWCMVHNCYSCTTCRLGGLSCKSTKELRGRKKRDEDNIGKNLMTKQQFNQKFNRSVRKNKVLRAVPVSPKAYFDPKITSQLSAKLKNFNFTEDILSSVDKLKVLTPNAIELILLNFMKQSFLNGSLKIWYSPPQSPSSRSRAFLTVSGMPPVSNALDISTLQTCTNNLPKIIADMFSIEHNFTNNELGILHCNGELWEIHGTLNITVEKNNSCQETEEEEEEEEIEQIFSSLPLPGMDELRTISTRILRVRDSKWWVLDMTQKFTNIVMTNSSTNTFLAKVTFLSYVRSRTSRFFPLAKDKGHLYGVYYSKDLYPFVLIGPFYVCEKNDKIYLTLNSSKRPFLYSGKENINSSYTLKFFINSVITCLSNSEKKLKGLWLYDKNYEDNTCYLEVSTVNIQGSFPKTDYSIETEHGYSMKSLTSCSSGAEYSTNPKSNCAPVQFKPVPVYLYFEIFQLGYVAAELQIDNSILITHPLSSGFRIISHKIGEVFISLLRKRIKFIPDNLQIKWFVTKHQEDLRGRKPFDKMWLGGVYILCKSGVFSLIQMTHKKIQDLGLNKEDVMQAASECRLLGEIVELKKLKNLLFGSNNEKVTTDSILRKAVEIIECLKQKEEVLKNAKAVAEGMKLISMTKYLTLLNSCAISDFAKIKHLEKVARFCRRESGNRFVKLLEKFPFGKTYLSRLENLSNKAEGEKTVIQIDSDKEEATDATREQETVQENDNGILVKSILKNKPRILRKKKVKKIKAIKVSNLALVQTLETKMYNVNKLLNSNAQSSNFPKHKELLKKLNKISNQLNHIKKIFKNGGTIVQRKQPKIFEKRDKEICQAGNVELVQGKGNGGGVRKEEAKTEKKFIKLDPLNISQCNANITVSNERSLTSKDAMQFEKLGEKLERMKSPMFKRNEPGEKLVLKNLRVVLTPLKKKNISSSRKILVVKNMKNNKSQKISILNAKQEYEGKSKVEEGANCGKGVQNAGEGAMTARKSKQIGNSSENNLFEMDVT